MIGQTISHYKILELLGGGGMGVVYKARDLKLDRFVALKFLSPESTREADAKERFVQEAKAASALEHNNICNIHEIGETEAGQLFIVMACYDGETLKTRLEKGPLDIDLALDIAIQIAGGLSRAHEAGIVHRDVKPANIMVTHRSEVKILDFGLAKLSGRTLLTSAGATLGTVAYMSPEQARSEQVDGRTDVWALGVVLYEMLAGRRPFESDYEQALIYSILNETPKPLRSVRPDVPEVVEQIVARAMARSVEDRYQKIDDLRSDLKVARGTAETGGTIAVAEAMERRQRRRLIRRLSIAGAAMLVIAGGLFVLVPLLQDQAIASNPKTIAIIGFENQTGDKSLDNLQMSLPSLLTASLDESKFFRVLTWDRIRAALGQMGKDNVQFIDKELGLEICRRSEVEALAMGTFTRAGDLFVTSLQVFDVRTGEPLMQPVRVDGQGVESILKSQVDELAQQVSRGLGVSRWATGTSLKPVQQLTTTSQEAYNFYVRGEAEFNRLNWNEALRYFRLAVKSDSMFASGWYFLVFAQDFAAAYAGGDTTGMSSAIQNAVRYAPLASEREQWHIGAYSRALRTQLYGGQPKTRLAYWQKCLERFPDDARAHQEAGLLLYTQRRYTEAIEHFALAAPVIVQSQNLLAYMYMYSNQPEKALEACRQYAARLPGDANPIDGMGEALWYAGRFDEAIPQFERAAEVKPEWTASEEESIGQLLFLKEEYEDALVRFDHARSPWRRAYTLVWLGRMKEAEKELRRMEGDPQAIWLRGWIAYEEGRVDDGRALMQAWAKQLPPPQEDAISRMFSDYCLGLIDLRQGRTDSAETRLAEMESLSALAVTPYDSVHIPLAFSLYGKALRAACLLARNRPADIDPQWGGGLMSWPMELERSHGASSRPINSWGGPRGATWIPVPCDIVPQAYLQRGMTDSAITAYELAVNKTFHYLCPIVPLYYYRLAKLYEQGGMKEKAAEQYAKFLKIWGKADPGFKEPADARARLAKLTRAGT